MKSQATRENPKDSEFEALSLIRQAFALIENDNLTCVRVFQYFESLLQSKIVLNADKIIKSYVSGIYENLAKSTAALQESENELKRVRGEFETELKARERIGNKQ